MSGSSRQPTKLSPIETAKARHGLEDVVRRTGVHIPHVQGRLVTVRCPMPAHGHYDRTPSLRLDLDSGRWWCFACSPTGPDGTPLSGDVIDWVCATEHVDWRQAIEILDSGRRLTNTWTVADRPPSAPAPSATSGPVDMPDLSRTPAQRIQSALNSAWMYYTTGSLHHAGVVYLSDRGIDVTLLEAHNRRYEVGRTPQAQCGLVDHLRRRGFTDDELVDAGLAHRRAGEKQLTDYYRRRVLIPVRDSAQQLAGFIGRNVGDDRWPKYKNPPHTARYDKSINLYQPLAAPDQPNGQVVVVEGTIDAMAIAVAAIRSGKSDWYCPITQSGRQLSPRQLRHVLDQHPLPPLIAMDGDPAGQDSNRRIKAAAQAIGQEVVVVTLPEGEDPASWIGRRGRAGLDQFTRASKHPDQSSAKGSRSIDDADHRAAVRLARTLASQRTQSQRPMSLTTGIPADRGQGPAL